YQKSEYDKMRASRWEDRVKDYQGQRITTYQSAEVRKRIAETKDSARQRIAQLEREQAINPTDSNAKLITNLMADPVFDAPQDAKDRYFEWTAIDESVARKMKADIMGTLTPQAPP